MSNSNRIDDLKTINRVCDEFENLVCDGTVPPIESFLSEIDPRIKPELLTELLKLELFYRRRFGEAPSIESYTQRFPVDQRCHQK